MRVRTYDPFRELDRFFTPTASRPTIPLDVVRHDDKVVLYFDLPGIDVDSIDLTVEKRELVLRAERTFNHDERADADDESGTQVVRSERRHGTFERTMLLAENLDTDDLTADYTNGVLTVEIPVVAAAQPRKIEITR